MDIIAKISEELGIKRHQTEAAVKLIDEGNTIPFIARYRKEATGALNDEVLRNLSERLTYLRGLEERKETVLASGFQVPLLRNGFRMVVFSVIIMIVVLFFRKGIMGERELSDLFGKRAKKAKKNVVEEGKADA